MSRAFGATGSKLALALALFALAALILWAWLHEPGPPLDGQWSLLPTPPVAGVAAPGPSAGEWPFGRDIAIAKHMLTAEDGGCVPLKVEAIGGEYAICWRGDEWHRCFVGGSPQRLIIVVGVRQLTFTRR